MVIVATNNGHGNKLVIHVFDNNILCPF